MMASVTFDILKFVEKLKEDGVPEAQAKAEFEALVTAFSGAMDTQLATKSYIIGWSLNCWCLSGGFGAGWYFDVNPQSVFSSLK